LRDDFEIEPPHFLERAAYQMIAIATGALRVINSMRGAT
jgi:hypothetical protein